MSDQDAFFDEIRATPEDIVPRLVYADWLEEQGDPDAELIRLQCELAEFSDDPAGRRKLIQRERELLADYRERWIKPLEKLDVMSIEIRRGFIEEVRLTAESFIAAATDLADQLPALCAINLRKSKKYIARLANLPELECVRFLDLTLAGLEDRDLKTLIKSPYLKNLVDLKLRGNNLSSEAASLIAESENLAGLKSLSLAANKIGRDGLRALGDSATLNELKRLDCASCGITAVGVNAFNRGKGLPALEFLDLSDNSLNGKLSLFRNSRELRSLDLTRTSLKPASVETLGNSPGLSSLQTLQLRGSGIKAEGVAAILGPSKLESLEDLDVSGVDGLGWNPERRTLEIPQLARRNAMTGLKRLRIDENSFDSSMTERIIESGCLESLVAFGAARTRLTDSQLREVMSHSRKLQYLNIARTECTEKTLSTLLAWPEFSELRLVVINGIRLHYDVVRAMETAPRNSDFRLVALSGSEFEASKANKAKMKQLLDHQENGFIHFARGPSAGAF